MEKHSQIVVGPDGTILAASGELPPGLLDTRLDDCASLSPAIRAAGKALLHQLRGSGGRLVGQLVEVDGPASVLVIAIEAVAIRRTATDLRHLLASKLAVISTQADAGGVTLAVKIADDVPAVVHLDAEKVAWAITTLVGNALRYVQTPSRRLGGKAIDVRASFDRASSRITIEVHDDGPGIQADTVRRIFLRDSLNVRGAGLALLLIRDIVAAHGGTVDLRSSTDPVTHGTTILLTFPAL
jgi:signal transduction histidine kinase